MSVFTTGNRLHTALGIGVIAAALFVVFKIAERLASTAVHEQTTEAGREVLLRYSFTLENRTNKLIEDIHFETFAPVTRTPYQRVIDIETNTPARTETDALGNQRLQFTVNQLPPFGQTRIEVSARVEMTNTPALASSWNDWGGFLSPEPFIEIDADELVELASLLRQRAGTDSSHAVMSQAHRWVASQLTDIGYVSEDRGALWALRTRSGDCTEFMYTTAALGRANGVATAPVAGFRAGTTSTVIRAMDYHNWLYFNAGNEWLLSDPHADVFDKQQDEYVVFRVLAPGSTNTESQSAQRFFVYDHRISAQMN